MVANELYSSNAMFINGMIASKCGQTGFHLEIFVWGGGEVNLHVHVKVISTVLQ